MTTKARAKGKASNVEALTAIPGELFRVYFALIKLGFCDLPLGLLKSLIMDSQLDHALNAERCYELLGDALLATFDSLGPVYGKAGQMFLSRLSPKVHSLADRIHLTRLYGDWPAMDFAKVSMILDREIPHWRAQMRVDPHPLGVASMAQVHKAQLLDGSQWVLKVIKPQAKRRLKQSLAAMDQATALLKSLPLTKVASRMVKELEEVSVALKREVSLDLEKDNIDRVRHRLSANKKQILRIPATLDAFSTENVLALECFEGIPLTDLVTGKAELSAEMKRKLARKMLTELLLQVFEVGLFHADPHAGNLILLEDGSVGIFDWGLTGELTESDRRHIASILKAILALDLDRLAAVLHEMSQESGREVKSLDIKKALQRLARLVKKRKEQDQPLALHEVLEESLKAADRLDIAIPEGLLLMAKSLLTIEGLAKGIDPEVSLARLATPVLFRAVKPGFSEILLLTRRLPRLARQFFRQESKGKSNGV